MVGPSRNFVFGPWTQEELERLFGGEMPDIDLITWYVSEQPGAAPKEAGSSRYALEDFTESQPVEGEEYVPSTQLPETVPREVPPRRLSVQVGGGPGSSNSRQGTSSASTAQTTGHATATGRDEGPSGSAPKRKKLTSPVWDDFIVSYSRNADESEDRWGTCKQCGKKIQAT